MVLINREDLFCFESCVCFLEIVLLMVSTIGYVFQIGGQMYVKKRELQYVKQAKLNHLQVFKMTLNLQIKVI